jgi:hypothetical protein
MAGCSSWGYDWVALGAAGQPGLKKLYGEITHGCAHYPRKGVPPGRVGSVRCRKLVSSLRGVRKKSTLGPVGESWTGCRVV